MCEMTDNLIITIGRQCGSGGKMIGTMLAERMGVKCYDKELLALAAKHSGLCQELFEKHDERPTSSFLYSLVMDSYSMGYTSSGFADMPLNHKIFLAQFDTIKKLANESSCVIVGRCADYILRDQPNVLRVFVHAPLDQRIRRAREEYGAAEDNLESYVIRQDKARASYHNYFAAGRWGQSREYDLCVNSRIGIGASVQVIKAAAKALVGE